MRLICVGVGIHVVMGGSAGHFKVSVPAERSSNGLGIASTALEY